MCFLEKLGLGQEIEVRDGETGISPCLPCLWTPTTREGKHRLSASQETLNGAKTGSGGLKDPLQKGGTRGTVP